MLLDTIGLFAVAALLGSMLFFPAVVAPTVFRSLAPADAGKFLRTLFPAYYAFIIIASLVGAAALFNQTSLSITLAAILVSTLAVRQILVPKINAWRDLELSGDSGAAARFKSGHRVSVLINLVQMAAVFWVLWKLV
ncbi:MAG: DUF4149 domain-containing protein [Pseudomonadota bacterium]